MGEHADELAGCALLGIADGWLEADGNRIYEASDLRVALFQA